MQQKNGAGKGTFLIGILFWTRKGRPKEKDRLLGGDEFEHVQHH